MRAGAGSVLVAVLLAACSATIEPAPSPASPPALTTTPPPSPPERIVVAVKGDWGAGTRAQRRVTSRMCVLRETEGFTDVLTTGDNFYPSGVASNATYDAPERCLYEAPGHRWRPSLGNHDQGDGTREALGESERWYRWSAGGADFFALDSNAPIDPAQRAWMAEQLEASTATVKIVYFHHPPFTVGSVHPGNGAVRNAWVPMFERYRVTLALAGHNHLYEHFETGGVHYVTTGGGGQVLYRCEREHPALRSCIAEHHFVLVAIEGTRVEVRAIDVAGAVIDRFEIDAA